MVRRAQYLGGFASIVSDSRVPADWSTLVNLDGCNPRADSINCSETDQSIYIEFDFPTTANPCRPVPHVSLSSNTASLWGAADHGCFERDQSSESNWWLPNLVAAQFGGCTAQFTFEEPGSKEMVSS
jgi:hypothetical protein